MLDCTETSSATPALETYESLTSFIETITKDLIEYTVFPLREHPHMAGMQVRKYLRDTARSLQRPDIFYDRWYWGGGFLRSRAKINLPKRKRIEPLVAPLLLLRGTDTVHVLSEQSRWGIIINDKPEIFDHWLARTRTDPEWRKILGLPTE